IAELELAVSLVEGDVLGYDRAETSAVDVCNVCEIQQYLPSAYLNQPIDRVDEQLIAIPCDETALQIEDGHLNGRALNDLHWRVCGSSGQVFHEHDFIVLLVVYELVDLGAHRQDAKSSRTELLAFANPHVRQRIVWMRNRGMGQVVERKPLAWIRN